MADGTRVDPFRGYNYLVNISGIGDLAFKTISGLEAEVEVTEYREGTDTATMRKLPGLTSYPNIVLERGVTDSPAILDWFRQVSDLNADSTLSDDHDFRMTVRITLRNRQQQEVRTWEVFNAWPAKFATADLDAESSDVLIDSLELAHEGWTMTVTSPT